MLFAVLLSFLVILVIAVTNNVAVVAAVATASLDKISYQWDFLFAILAVIYDG